MTAYEGPHSGVHRANGATFGDGGVIRPLLILAGVLLLLALQLWCYWTPSYHGGVDEASYLLTARGLALHGDPAVYQDDPRLFVPENLVEVKPGVFYQKYPIGFPMLLAGPIRLFSLSAAFLVNPVAAGLLVIGLFLLARHFVSTTTALLAATLMALHPLLLYHATSLLSHVTEACFVVWAMWLLIRWHLRGGCSDAALGGFLLGFAISIRYTGATLLLPVTLAIVSRWRSLPVPCRRFWLRELPSLAAGFLLGTLPLLVWGQLAFGRPWATGYGLSGESTAFSLASFCAHLSLLWRLISSGSGLPLVSVLAVLSALMPIASRIRWRKASTASPDTAGDAALQQLFLWVWIAPTLLLYTAYYWTSGNDMLALRFFLPVYPPIIIGAAIAIDRLSGGRGMIRICLSLCLIAVLLICRFRPPVQKELNDDLIMRSLTADAASLTARYISPGTLLIADDWQAYDAVCSTPADIVDPADFDTSTVADKLGRSSGPGPRVLNAQRAKRFAAARGQGTQFELDKVLRQLIAERLASGGSVRLLILELTETGGDQKHDAWEERLAPGFLLRRIDQSDWRWSLYSVEGRH